MGEGEGRQGTIGIGEEETMRDTYAEVTLGGNNKGRDRGREGGTCNGGEDKPGKGVVSGEVH